MATELYLGNRERSWRGLPEGSQWSWPRKDSSALGECRGQVYIRLSGNREFQEILWSTSVNSISPIMYVALKKI